MTLPANNPSVTCYRGNLLYFKADGDACLVDRGLLAVSEGKVLEVGEFSALQTRYADAPVVDYADKIIAPGFVDMHLHYPQLDVIGSPAPGLLQWLEQYTFVEEQRFSDGSHAAVVAKAFLDQLLRHGVTTALTFATSHVASVNALFEAACDTGHRIITGKCLQDRHCPEGVRDQTEQSLIDTEKLILRWQYGHEKNRRLGYAITPRFAPSCSPAQLQGAGQLAAKYPSTWIQSHVSENLEEINWAKQLFPHCASYLDIYQQAGLLRERSVYAHCIHFDDNDRAMMHGAHAAAAVCPTSNLFLGSGFFDFDRAQQASMLHGLASDVGGGTSFSPFKTMLAAYAVGRSCAQSGLVAKTPVSLTAQHLWWMHTAGAARALGLEGKVGNLLPGCDADFIVLDTKATPILARRTQQANTLNELLFALIVLGDERVVHHTITA